MKNIVVTFRPFEGMAHFCYYTLISWMSWQFNGYCFANMGDMIQFHC